MTNLDPLIANIPLNAASDSRKVGEILNEEPRPNGGRLSSGRTPIGSFVDFIQKNYLKPIRNNPDFKQLFLRVFNFLVVQKTLRPDCEKNNRMAVLIARRWVYAAHKNPAYADPTELINEILEGDTLFSKAAARPQDPKLPLNGNYTRLLCQNLLAFSTFKPILSKQAVRARKDPGDLTTNSPIPRWKRCRRAIDPTCPFLAIIPVLVAELHNKLSKAERLSKEDAFHALLTLISIHFGVYLPNTFHASVNQNAGCLSFYPREDRVLIHINNGYHPSSNCWRPSSICLPLHPMFKRLLKILNLIDFKGLLLEMPNNPFGRGTKMVDNIWKKNIDLLDFSPLKKFSKRPSFHTFHRHVASLLMKVHPERVCLFEGKPLWSNRGPCSYESATNQDLVQHYLTFLTYVDKKVPRNAYALPKTTRSVDEVHGCTSPPYAAQIAALRTDINSARTRNEILFCYREFCGLLGLRRSRYLINLVGFHRNFPTEHLLIVDKKVGDEATSRPLPVKGIFDSLLAQLQKSFPNQFILKFQNHKGKHVDLNQLDRECRPPTLRELLVQQSDAMQPGRTAFINALRSELSNDRIRQICAGHSPTMAWSDWQQPESSQLLLEGALAELSLFFVKFEVDKLGSLLAAKIKAFFPEPARQVKNRLSSLRDCPARFQLPPPSKNEAPCGLSREEDAALHSLKRNLSKKILNDKGCRSKNRLSLAKDLVRLLILRGVPYRNLRRFSRYYSAGSFVIEKLSGDVFFILVFQDTDAGGLTPYFHRVANLNKPNDPLLFLLNVMKNKTNNGSSFCGKKWNFTEELRRKRNKGRGRNLSALFALPGQQSLKNSPNKGNLLTPNLFAFLCRFYFPGYCAGNLLGYGPKTLNHIDWKSVFHYSHSSNQLFFFHDDKPFEMSHQGHPASELENQISAKLARMKTPFPRDPEKWMEHFRTGRFQFTKKTYEKIRELLEDQGVFGLPSFLKYFNREIRNGTAPFSPPLPFVYPGEVLGSSLLPLTLNNKGSLVEPRSIHNCPKTQRREQARIRKLFILVVMAQTGCRIREATKAVDSFDPRLLETENHSIKTVSLREASHPFFVDEQRWSLSIYKTKTKAGRRIVFSDLVSPLPTENQPLLNWAESLSSRLFRASKYSGERTFIRFSLKHLGTSPYNLRHGVIAQAAKTFLAMPNSTLRIQALTRQVGHLSDAVTFLSYVGSALSAFACGGIPANLIPNIHRNE